MSKCDKKILYVVNITRSINCFFIPHINMLLEEGFTVDCACKLTGERPVHEEKLIKKIKFYDIPVTKSIAKFDNWIMLYKLYKIQKENQYDIIHLHSPIVGAFGRLLKLIFPKVKMIYTAHGYHFHKRSSKKSWMVFYRVEKFLSKFTDVLVTINKEDFEVSKSFKCKKLINVHGVGVDPNEFKPVAKEEISKLRESIGIKQDDFLIAMVGEHNENKNQIQLIKAMQKLSEINPKVKAILVGDGRMLEDNIKLVNDEKIDNVKILGFREDINEIMNSINALASLSYREGLPKNVLEAIYDKKPVIGTNTRGINELVLDGQNGYIVEVGDIDKTAEVINKLSRMSEKELKQFGDESFEIAKPYLIDKVLEEMKQVY